MAELVTVAWKAKTGLLEQSKIRRQGWRERGGWVRGSLTTVVAQPEFRSPKFFQPDLPSFIFFTVIFFGD